MLPIGILGAHKSALAVLKNESSSSAQRVGASFALKEFMLLKC